MLIFAVTFQRGATPDRAPLFTDQYGAAMLPKDYEESAWFAGYSGDIGEAMTVKELGHSVDAKCGAHQSTAFYAACAEGNLSVVEYLASTPGLVDINARNRFGATPFFAACNRGHTKVKNLVAPPPFRTFSDRGFARS